LKRRVLVCSHISGYVNKAHFAFCDGFSPAWKAAIVFQPGGAAQVLLDLHRWSNFLLETDVRLVKRMTISLPIMVEQFER